MPVKFFISYSHDEYTFKDELVKHLRGLERNGQIEIWTDEQIVPGQEWDESIRSAMLTAGIIVFMVSRKFIRSRYIKEVELKEAMERYNGKGVVLVPIILETIEQELMDLLPLQKFESLPVVNKKLVPVTEWTPQTGAYDNIISGIQRTLENLPGKNGVYSEIIGILRNYFKKDRVDDLFKEIDKIEGKIKSIDMDLFNTYANLRLQWKKVRLDEIRRTRDADQNRRDFNFQLLDFITSLEKMFEEER